MKRKQDMASEKALIEELTLMYFNNYLFSRGVITESERNRMVAKIAARGSVKTKKNINI